MALSDGLRELEVGLHLKEHCQLARQGLKRRYTHYKHIEIGHEPNITQVISFLNLFQESHMLKIGILINISAELTPIRKLVEYCTHLIEHVR